MTHRDCFGDFDPSLVDDVTTTFRVQTATHHEQQLTQNHEKRREDEDERHRTETNKNSLLQCRHRVAIKISETDAMRKSAPVLVVMLLSSYSSGASANTPKHRPKYKRRMTSRKIQPITIPT